MREFDFLPEWYKQGQRRQSHMRKQYIALASIFLAMMAFNVTATHRASRVAAELVRLEGQRVYAEGVTHEFNRIIRRLNELKTKADLMGRIDSKIDVAAILAELSHLIGEPVVLNRTEFIAEPLRQGQQKEETKTQMIRVAGRTTGADTGPVLAGVRFRIVLAGVAAHPAHVADLVCKLDESRYFEPVSLSFSRGTRIQVGEAAVGASPASKTTAKPTQMLDVTEFEIVCYLANYEEVGT